MLYDCEKHSLHKNNNEIEYNITRQGKDNKSLKLEFNEEEDIEE
jgi:hypothetical protein